MTQKKKATLEKSELTNSPVTINLPKGQKTPEVNASNCNLVGGDVIFNEEALYTINQIAEGLASNAKGLQYLAQTMSHVQDLKLNPLMSITTK